MDFIDLFAGIGGIRLGFEKACRAKKIPCKCVFTSEIKPAAIKVLKHNHPKETVYGDITTIDASEIPAFDVLLAGFPCQAFSFAGKRQGFADTRGTLFFEVERILREKQPKGFILENVEGLINHDNGRTLATILNKLDLLGYKVNWACLNAKDFGLAQDRKRVYIVGTLTTKPALGDFKKVTHHLGDILEHGLKTEHSEFIDLLMSKYSLDELYGKSIKDKRGGDNNIHSWDIGIKGEVTDEEKDLLNELFKQRRKKKWAEEIGIDWMDGMPLTYEQISTFNNSKNLKKMLDNLTEKGYLKLEHPKKLVKEVLPDGTVKSYRVQDPTKTKGYNIVTGKLSFSVTKILDPNDFTPTLVATDMEKLYVVDGDGIRKLTLVEGLRLFGYPDKHLGDTELLDGYDLLGNTVAVPVIKAVASRVIDIIK